MASPIWLSQQQHQEDDVRMMQTAKSTHRARVCDCGAALLHSHSLVMHKLVHQLAQHRLQRLWGHQLMDCAYEGRQHHCDILCVGCDVLLEVGVEVEHHEPAGRAFRFGGIAQSRGAMKALTASHGLLQRQKFGGIAQSRGAMKALTAGHGLLQRQKLSTMSLQGGHLDLGALLSHEEQ
eukprot:1160464-Pelagomonas_calceolata.AAC.4